MPAYRIEAGTAQHIGDRPQQTDRVALYKGARAPGYLLAVLADGVQGGAVAADQVLQTSKQLFDEFSAGETASVARITALLRDIAHESHTIVRLGTAVASNEPLSSMVLLVLTPDHQAIWAHVGESRLYRFFRSQCAARTTDAAYVDHLVQEDGLALESAKKHRNSALLGNAIGHPLRQPFVTVGSHDGLQAGDAFLLCSDGVWAYFTDTELATAVDRKTPREAAERLISKGMERARGKGDNASMVIVKLAAPPLESANYTVQGMGRAV